MIAQYSKQNMIKFSHQPDWIGKWLLYTIQTDQEGPNILKGSVPDNRLNSTRCFYYIFWVRKNQEYYKCFIGPFSRTARPKVAGGSKGTNRISKRGSVLWLLQLQIQALQFFHLWQICFIFHDIPTCPKIRLLL